MLADDSRSTLGLDNSLEISLKTCCSAPATLSCSPKLNTKDAIPHVLLGLILCCFEKLGFVCFGTQIEVCRVLCELKTVFHSAGAVILHYAAFKPSLSCSSAVNIFSF